MSIFASAVHYLPLIVLGILPVMNPLSTIPLFLSLTDGMTDEQKTRQVRMACVYSVLILVAFLLLGNGIISLFGISLDGIRVAGGLIILFLSFRMLFPPSAPSNDDTQDAKASSDFSFSPLAMPSMAGPGTIAVVMGYASHIPAGHTLLGYIVISLAILIVVFIAYLALIFSTSIAARLGKSGIDAISKIMGFLLACIAVQFIASGVHDFVIDLAKKI